MPYTYTLTSIIPASAEEIYNAWLDSLAHSEMTGGGEARMSDEIGAAVSAWDGYISGRNLELIPGERIVQSWRTTRFTDEHGDSIITVTLEDADRGTLLTLVHSDVPEDQRSYEEGGWESNYFVPMRAYFGGRNRGAAGAPPKRAAAPTRRKAKRPVGARSEHPMPRAKASSRKKAKRALGARAKPGPAKPTVRKTTRRAAPKRRARRARAHR